MVRKGASRVCRFLPSLPRGADFAYSAAMPWFKHAALAFAIASITATQAMPSNACIVAAEPPPPHLDTVPATGAVDVPTDVAILVLNVESPTARLSTLDGTAVATTTATLGSGDSEIRPDEPLLPNTEYELEIDLVGAPNDVWAVRFTTGMGPTLPDSEPPQVALERWVFADDVQRILGCSASKEGTCVAVEDGEYFEVTKLHGDSGGDAAANYDVAYYQGSFVTDLGTVSNGDGSCIRLRKRLANGSLTKATEICGSDAPTYELGDNASFACTSHGIEHDGKKTRLDPGCSVTPGSRLTGASAATIALAGFATALLAARRRRQR